MFAGLDDIFLLRSIRKSKVGKVNISKGSLNPQLKDFYPAVRYSVGSWVYSVGVLSARWNHRHGPLLNTVTALRRPITKIF